MKAATRCPGALLAVWILSSIAALEGCDERGLSSRAVRSSPRALESPVPIPELRGPVSDRGTLRGHPWMAPDETLSPLEPDFVSEEYFFSGRAGGWTRDGEPDGTTAPYTSRMLVIRPVRQEFFNGTVLVEWLNVTGELEVDVIWAQTYRELLHEGYAYVAVSVQEVGVETSPLALKLWDPIRYAPLSHPNDAYAYDIFAQAARALFARGAVRPMGDLTIERLIASGESQSAAHLIPYVNEVDPIHRVFDGYFIHTFPGVVRDGVGVPVLMLLSEAEVEGITSPIGIAAQSPDGFGELFGNTPLSVLSIPPPEHAGPDLENFRLWEVAGASHYDRQALVYVVAQASRGFFGSPSYGGLPLGCAKLLELSVPYPELLPPDLLGLGRINQLAMERPAQAALHALHEWMVTGIPPPAMPRMSRNENGTIRRDGDGLATGGIRMPVMEEPVGVNEGTSCVFFGRYTELEDAANRYESQEDYLQKLRAAADEAVSQGVLLPPEADAYIEEARAETSSIWGP